MAKIHAGRQPGRWDKPQLAATELHRPFCSLRALGFGSRVDFAGSSMGSGICFDHDRIPRASIATAIALPARGGCAGDPGPVESVDP